MGVGVGHLTCELVADDAAEWERLLDLLGDRTALELGAFTALSIDADSRTLTVQQDFPANW